MLKRIAFIENNVINIVTFNLVSILNNSISFFYIYFDFFLYRLMNLLLIMLHWMMFIKVSAVYVGLNSLTFMTFSVSIFDAEFFFPSLYAWRRI